MTATMQLRVYTIREGELEQFVREWQAGVVPLRARHAFHVDHWWTGTDHRTFAWVMRFDGAGDWDSADDAYYASPERAALDPDPAKRVEEIRTWFIATRD